MKTLKMNLSFEIKSMGFSFFIPILLSFFIIIFFLSINRPVVALELAIPVMEYLFVPFSCWWSIYLFYDYYEDFGSEVLFSYPLTKREHGIFRIGIFFLLYLILLLMNLTILDFLHPDFLLIKLLLQFVPEIIFFTGLGSIIVNFLRSPMLSISFVSIYVAVEFLTKGNLLPLYHPFFSNTEPAHSIVELASKGVINTLLGLIFLKATNYFLEYRS